MNEQIEKKAKELIIAADFPGVINGYPKWIMNIAKHVLEQEILARIEEITSDYVNQLNPAVEEKISELNSQLQTLRGNYEKS